MTSTRVSDHRLPYTESARVGSFETAYGAELAIEHLVTNGFARERLRVRPGELSPADHWQERLHRRPRTLRSIALGLLPVPVLVALAMTTSLTAAAWYVAVGAVVTTISVVVAVLVERDRAMRTRQQARADRTVLAARFDVIGNEAPARATHVLARWWDPAAPPVASPALVAPAADTTSDRRLRAAA